jgi:hypothetical protein
VRRHFQLVSAEAPAQTPAQRALEMCERAHDDGIHVLRVKLWVVQQPPVEPVNGQVADLLIR